MKVIHTLDHFLPEQIGGTEVYIVSLAKSLINHEIESVVVIPNYGKNENETYNVESIRVIKYGETSVANRSVILGKEIPKGLLNFEKVLNEEKPDVVHFHSIGSSIGITIHHLIKAKMMGFRTLLTMHLASYTGNMLAGNATLNDGVIDVKKYTAAIFASKPLSPIKRKLLFAVAMGAYRINYDATNWHSSFGTAIGFPFVIDRLKKNLFSIAENSDRIVVLTKWYKKILLLNGIDENKLVHIAQGLPVQERLTGNTEPGNALRLIYIGRIIEEKGLHLLLEAVQSFSPGEITLDIYGQQAESGYYKSWKEKTSGLSNISWKGVLEPPSVVNSLRNYDLLCVPSIVCEMSPLVIQEAYAAGIPVIASNVYGNAEQIKDGINGWLFKVNDSSDLSVMLQKLTENPDLIKEAKQRLPEVRPFSDVAKDYEILYKEILQSS